MTKKSAIKQIIGKLIEQKKEWLIDEKKEDGFTPLHLACLNNHLEVVKLIIEFRNQYINTKNLNLQTALHLAIDRQHYEIVKYLLENKCNVNLQNKDGDSPFHCLIRNHNLNHIKQYVADKKLPTKSNGVKMIEEIACLLIQNEANLYIKNKKDQTVLDLSSDPDLSKFLVNQYQNKIK